MDGAGGLVFVNELDLRGVLVGGGREDVNLLVLLAAHLFDGAGGVDASALIGGGGEALGRIMRGDLEGELAQAFDQALVVEQGGSGNCGGDDLSVVEDDVGFRIGIALRDVKNVVDPRCDVRLEPRQFTGDGGLDIELLLDFGGGCFAVRREGFDLAGEEVMFLLKGGGESVGGGAGLGFKAGADGQQFMKPDRFTAFGWGWHMRSLVEDYFKDSVR